MKTTPETIARLEGDIKLRYNSIIYPSESKSIISDLRDLDRYREALESILSVKEYMPHSISSFEKYDRSAFIAAEALREWKGGDV